MTTVSKLVHATPEAVFSQLADGWIFPVWVVGATHIRDVDDDWPAVGLPAPSQGRVRGRSVIEDSTQVLEMTPNRRLVLQARAKLFGQARVEIVLEPSGDDCLVTMGEAPTEGVVHRLDNPLQRYALRQRNIETLERLATLAEKRMRLSDRCGVAASTSAGATDRRVPRGAARPARRSSRGHRARRRPDARRAGEIDPVDRRFGASQAGHRTEHQLLVDVAVPPPTAPPTRFASAASRSAGDWILRARTSSAKPGACRSTAASIARACLDRRGSSGAFRADACTPTLTRCPRVTAWGPRWSSARAAGTGRCGMLLRGQRAA